MNCFEQPSQYKGNVNVIIEDNYTTYGYTVLRGVFNATSAPITASQRAPQHYKQLEWVLYNYVVVAICAIGFLGNLLNLIVLAEKGFQRTMDRLEKSAHVGLLAMAVSDGLFCLVALPHAWVEENAFYFTGGFDMYYALYSNAVINILIMTSTWLTVIIAIGRYTAVCHPLRAREYIGKTFTYVPIVVVYIVCFVFNLPRFLFNHGVRYQCVDGSFVYFKGVGFMNQNTSLKSSYMWCYFVICIMVPILILSYCNVHLIRALRQSAKMRKRFRRGDHHNSNDSTQRISLTLVVIVMMYLILVAPAIMLDFVRDVLLGGYLQKDSTDIYNLIVAICNVFQAFNFASNFVLYCIINVYFRKSVARLCCCGGSSRSAEPTDYSSVSNTRITLMKYETATNV